MNNCDDLSINLCFTKQSSQVVNTYLTSNDESKVKAQSNKELERRRSFIKRSKIPKYENQRKQYDKVKPSLVLSNEDCSMRTDIKFKQEFQKINEQENDVRKVESHVIIYVRKIRKKHVDETHYHTECFLGLIKYSSNSCSSVKSLDY